MNYFDTLHTLMKEIDKVEDSLRTLRDQVDLATKPSINGAIREAQALRSGLWEVDKALEKEISG